MAGSEGHRAVLDFGLADGAVRAHYVEAEMKLDGARVTVVGMARSGVAAVELLLKKGAKVTAVDQRPVEGANLAALGVRAVAQTDAAFEGADLIVLSPGVPADLDLVSAARRRGVKVIGDL